MGEDINGASVQITDTVAALARPREILVSRTVRDLVAGSGITFAARGSYLLDAPAEEWPLFAVTGVQHEAQRAARRRWRSAQTSATRRSWSSRVPEVSMTMSATASRCSRLA